MSLTDDEVQNQIRVMVSFIDQEAKEKAEEIDTKAEEEFQIEKGKIVESQRQKISEHYAKKEKQLNQQKLVKHSHMLNRNRLQMLKSRDDQIKTVIDQTKQALFARKDDPTLLEDLMVQSLLQVTESEVTFRVLQDQFQLVQQVLPNAINRYAQTAGKAVNVKIDDSKFLTADKIGGVVLITKNNRLVIDNTLMARVELVGQQLLPEIRNILFGRNPNRKFDD